MARDRIHPEFIRYTHFIANHNAYEGMPDTYKDDGEIQWEAPSNRKAGKFKDTHHKRREWWRKKAIQIGIDPRSANWISRTAKAIHPTKEKPCGVCGRVMDLRYAYPSSILLNRIRKLHYTPDNFPLDECEHIASLVSRLAKDFSPKIYSDLHEILKAKGILIPRIEPDLKAWLQWIDSKYIPQEPSVLSPGAMSNAPDRFDGFHTYNRCCRHKEDKGRSTDNLRTYTTDRRVFEYWNEGNWIAADRLVGQIRSCLRDQMCRNGHPGPCSADHIGPLSLGFAHRPEFQLLCSSCNSAKNNRMMLSDVTHLIGVERNGECVVGWYAKAIWDARKTSVVDEETALRLSKLMRDNRHTAMSILHRFTVVKQYGFLTTFMELSYADYDVEFVNLRVENHMTRYDDIVYSQRTTKYAVEQKARRFRIALESVKDYFEKKNRNEFVISNRGIEKLVDDALLKLKGMGKENQQINDVVTQLLSPDNETYSEFGFRKAIELLPDDVPQSYAVARRMLQEAMRLVAEELSKMWDDERYKRSWPEYTE